MVAGVKPLDAINLGYVEGITYVGEEFGSREMFLPDMLAAAEAMKAAVAILEPEMKKQGSHREMPGKVVLGTAKGDIHDIGENLVGTMLSASGFEGFDLGTKKSHLPVLFASLLLAVAGALAPASLYGILPSIQEKSCKVEWTSAGKQFSFWF
jgi:cobalamin-dependent methionine synthase I